MLVRRIYESLLAFAFLLVAMPVVWWRRMRGRRQVRVVTVYGRLGQPLSYRIERLFSGRSRLRFMNHWHVIGMVFLGKVGLTGPMPVRISKSRPAYTRFAVRPGLISPYELQRRMNIAFNEVEISEERLITDATAGSHVALLLRYLLALVLGGKAQTTAEKIRLMDVTLHNHSLQTALTRIGQFCKGAACKQVAFVNPHCLNIASRDDAYRELLQDTPMVLADGIGIHLALKFFTNDALRDNVNGTDLFPHLCRMAAREHLAIFLLGGEPGVAEAVAAQAQQRVRGLEIAGTHHGFFSASDNDALVQEINRSGADIVLVAMGVPWQDKWIAANKHMLNASIAMGVGGLFDFYSGRIARAPLWMREMGLEWAYRLLQEPQRMWRRYVVGNPLFLWRAWRWARKHAVIGDAQLIEPKYFPGR